jgi:succinate dehydrogenase / fumarate reductase cytochrome b subunit
VTAADRYQQFWREESAVKDQRPVNLEIGTMRLPITAWASISHRISGVVLFGASALALWALDRSLASAAGFNEVVTLLTSPIARFIGWAALTALLYHSLAGVRHLIMDFGIGETLEGGVFGARAVIVLSVIGAAGIGVWLW